MQFGRTPCMAASGLPNIQGAEMKRWHEDYFRTHREWKKHYLVHVETNIRMSRPGEDPFQIDCVCDQQKGRFRKVDAWDCGNTRCHMCHGDKFPVRERTRQELRAELKLKEGVKDVREASNNC